MARQSSDEQHDGGGVEEGAGRFDGTLEVFGQTPVSADPSEEALDHPSPRLDGEADLIGLGSHDLNSNARCLRDFLSGVGTIGEQLFDEWKQGARNLQQVAASITVLDVGGMRFEDKAAPIGIDQNVALAAFDLLARIIAARAAGFGGF